MSSKRSSSGHAVCSGPGIAPVRHGYLRDYQASTKLAIARALEWPPDAIDRLLAGEPVNDEPPAVDVSPLVQIAEDMAAMRAEMAVIAAAVRDR